MSLLVRTSTAALSALAIAAVTCSCASQAPAGDSAADSSKKSSVERYVGDAALTTKVKAELVKDVGAKAATEVSVTTEGGVVQLAGFASSRDEADRAVAAAKNVSGVRDVKDDIRLK
ncbi:MAG TPA: BON domain-containing protein [Burkholderiales bacterium]|nr:BON domain-containing protein [Burkholderiales bacterium]